MMLGEPALTAARRARDPRFDGRFYVGVVTTGIYCRPICPARPPRPENVRYFACAAAAAAAGLRPCRRCRPELTPATWAANGGPALVARGLKLIEDGALDRSSVPRLAARLGVGERQLRRLFLAHLGASPLEVAATRRLHFARRLIEETRLPIATVATAAGFGSLRRFHFAFRRAFAAAPRRLRRAGGPAPAAAALRLRLAYRPPFDWEGLLAFLGRRALPGVERVIEGAYRRAAGGPGGAGVIEVRHDPAHRAVVLCVPPGLGGALLDLAARVRRLFDLDADSAAIDDHLAADPALAAAVRACPGLRVPGSFDPFETAVRAVLGQQVSVAAATTLAGRLVARFGAALGRGGEPGLDRRFPGPARLAEAPIESIGIVAARARGLRALAARVASGEPLLERAPSLEEALRRLEDVEGIGPWTARYIAMRALGEPDAYPAGDLALERAFPAASGRSERWRPYRAYAAMRVWSAAAPVGPRQAGRGR